MRHKPDTSVLSLHFFQLHFFFYRIVSNKLMISHFSWLSHHFKFMSCNSIFCFCHRIKKVILSHNSNFSLQFWFIYFQNNLTILTIFSSKNISPKDNITLFNSNIKTSKWPQNVCNYRLFHLSAYHYNSSPTSIL